MNSEAYDLKNDIKAGKDIFERLPNDVRPFWAGLGFTSFYRYSPYQLPQLDRNIAVKLSFTLNLFYDFLLLFC